MVRAKAVTEVFDQEEGDDPSPMDRKAAELASDLAQLGIVAENPADSYEPPAELMARNDAFISVHRIDPNTKERIYCCQYAPAEFTLERLRLDKGGGYYWVKLLAPNPNNRGRPSVFWSAYPKLEGPPRTDNQPSSGAVVTVHPQTTHDNVALLSAIKELGTLIGQALHQPQPAAPTRKEMLEEMRLMRDMFQPTQPETPQAGGIGLLREMLTLARELQPSDPDASPAAILMNAADKLLPMLGTVLAAQAQPVVTQPAQPAQPVQVHPLIQAAPPESDMNMRLKLGIGYLVSQAINDAPPDTSAYMILDNVPDDDIQSFVSRPDWLEFLASFDPRVTQYAPWFGKLREEIVTILAESSDDENLTTQKQESTTGAITTGTAGNR